MNERLQQEQEINQQLLASIEESKERFEQVSTQAASSEQVAAQLQTDLQVPLFSLILSYIFIYLSPLPIVSVSHAETPP